MSNKQLNIKVVNPVAREFYSSKKNYDSDSGLDLFILEDITLTLGETKKIDLGIQCEMLREESATDTLPYYLYPRSSFSKTPLILGNHVGIIDKDYRGNILAVVKFMPTYNIFQKFIEEGKTSFNETYTIKKGTRLFQICANDLSPFKYTIVDTLSDTARGINGLGSTGK
jgi:dUTP pyrophosphatase